LLVKFLSFVFRRCFKNNQPRYPVNYHLRKKHLIKIAVKTGGGVGDYIMLSRLLERINLEFNFPAIDIYYDNPLSGKELFASAPYIRKVQIRKLRPILTFYYDYIIKTVSFYPKLKKRVLGIFFYDITFFSNLEKFRTDRFRFFFNFLLYQEMFKFNPLDRILARFCVDNDLNRRTISEALMGLEIKRGSVPSFYLNYSDYLSVSKYINEGAYITIHPGWDDRDTKNTKFWPDSCWKEFLSRFKQSNPSFRVIQLGLAHRLNLSGVDLDLSGRTSLGQTG